MGFVTRFAVAAIPLVGALAGGCSDAAKYNAACRQALAAICAHQDSCGLIFDELECQDSIEADVVCNPSATVAELQACEAAANQGSCLEPVPEVCYDKALCDAIVGCKNITGCRPSWATNPTTTLGEFEGLPDCTGTGS